jgi:sulfur relay (sulfurtransferase) complex TusBCD TusD component (DsrE family)
VEFGAGARGRYHGQVTKRDPTAMRNLPLVAFRLTHAQRMACQEVADARGVSVNEIARRALLADVERVNTGVNTGGLRELTVVRDE